MDRKIVFHDRTDAHGDKLHVEDGAAESHETPILYFCTTTVGANLDYAQVLKLRDVLSEWLGRNLNVGPKLWTES